MEVAGASVLLTMKLTTTTLVRGSPPLHSPADDECLDQVIARPRGVTVRPLIMNQTAATHNKKVYRHENMGGYVSISR